MAGLTDRQIARKYISFAIRVLTNNATCIHDMSDSHALCEQLDIMEREINDADSMTPISTLHELAQDCALEILLHEGYPI